MDKSRTLRLASKTGAIGLIQSLIAEGVDINAILDLDGRAPLHWAAYHGQVAAIELLVSKGGDLEARDYLGYTPLHLAALRSQFSATLTLLAMGANINACNGERYTPLLCAASNGNTSVS